MLDSHKHKDWLAAAAYRVKRYLGSNNFNIRAV